MISGIHHLALFTHDMDETVRFWTSVLQTKLVRAARDTDGDPGSRHYYFDVGGGNLIAFFEFPGQDRESLQFGWMHQVALRLNSIEELQRLRDHIASYNVPISEITEHDFVRSAYLHDPNGILIELAVPSRELTEGDLRNDPRPVAALKEMLDAP